ncbi:hypothetical protein JR370_004296 [Salmonella enterica subsp. enterica serovar Muenchen]|nr:hypothetical protein [Salmonella enterica subsp. enterica serovar Poona]EHC7832302.1 hypothetical protein [Salmonella enterica subsp. enterica serovar Muenchen]
MRNTLSTLIVRHGDNLLRRSGWPETVGVTQVAPGVVPGWLAVCGVLSAAEILALTTHLCQPLNYGRAQLLTASVQRLAGTPVRLHLYPVQAYPHPATVRECTEIRLPYAQEWLTADEYADLLGNWRLLADEYDHDNWLDEEDEDGLDKVLDAVLVRNASFCPVLLTLVNEPEEEIEAAGVITDCLRFPGEPVRRWLDRRVLRDVVNEARSFTGNIR